MEIDSSAGASCTQTQFAAAQSQRRKTDNVSAIATPSKIASPSEVACLRRPSSCHSRSSGCSAWLGLGQGQGLGLGPFIAEGMLGCVRNVCAACHAWRSTPWQRVRVTVAWLGLGRSPGAPPASAGPPPPPPPPPPPRWLWSDAGQPRASVRPPASVCSPLGTPACAGAAA
eukprot:scaffold82702_cov59-Phaeocystis_antarctica.AAC.4